MKFYLFIDDVEGHETVEGINGYIKNLMNDFNIKLVFKFLEHKTQIS